MDVPIRADLLYVESRLNYDETKIWSKIVKPSLANGNLLRRKNRPAKARPRSRGTLVLGLERLGEKSLLLSFLRGKMEKSLSIW